METNKNKIYKQNSECMYHSEWWDEKWISIDFQCTCWTTEKNSVTFPRMLSVIAEFSLSISEELTCPSSLHM